MANDRIRIQCKGCGVSLMLYKYYPQRPDLGIPGGYVRYGRYGLGDFMSSHLLTCHPGRAQTLSLDGDPGFVLATESAKE